ncbi:hypothetical protein [Ramlibacter albus]|uniref:Conjugal transfer protein TrbJ n=1 Tax=Ramlibacter albus TaxID=2079448 RepID=A0A923MC24_9BURK|nr:hypothetical protein [Ramlibacter albus]MBC5767628.1 hypothetical protein [Ramlibacter albus]
MSKLEKLKAWILVLCTVAAAPAHAGGGFAGATEPTQLMNNVELVKVALDSAKSASTLVQKYMLQIQQYQAQLQNLKQLSNLPTGLPSDLTAAYNTLSSYRNAITTLEGSLGNQVQAIETRLTEARLSGMSWSQYVSTVSNDATRRQKRAVERLKYEEDLLKQVQSDYEFARQLQPTINTTEGVQQSMALLNSQMNRVVTQNAKLLEVLSQTVGDRAERDAAKAADDQQSAAQREAMRKRQEAIEQRQRSFGGFQ